MHCHTSVCKRFSVKNGWPAKIFSYLRAAGPPAKIVLVHGAPAGSVTHFALHMAFAGIAREKPVVYLDGGNSFDPFLISKTSNRFEKPSPDSSRDPASSTIITSAPRLSSIA